MGKVKTQSGLKLILGILVLTFLAGCSSAKIKARKEERERTASASHLYCDFVNGETYPDAEVQLSIEMGHHCEADKPMTVTNYRSPSENIGLIYCCNYKVDAYSGESKPRGR